MEQTTDLLQITLHNEAHSEAFPLTTHNTVKVCTQKNVFKSGDCIHKVILHKDDLIMWVSYQIAGVDVAIKTYLKKGISMDEFEDFFSAYVRMINNLLILELEYNIQNGVKDGIYGRLDQLNTMLSEFYYKVYEMEDCLPYVVRYKLGTSYERANNKIEPYEHYIEEAEDED